MTKVKICGVRTPEHALVAAEAGADYVGTIFADESARKVTPQHAGRIADALHAANLSTPRPLLVGVFVNQPVALMNDLAETCGLDMIQLSGDEPWDVCNQLNRPVIKVLHVEAGQTSNKIYAELAAHGVSLQDRGGFYLLEPKVEGQYGGTGQRLSLDLAQHVAEKIPFLLAGGLTPDNVTEAVSSARPWGVDVSSGVETDRMKDPEKIRSFIAAVRAVDTSKVT